MTLAIYPTLPGLSYDIKRSPQFQTKVQRSASGRELRCSMQQYPLTEFTLSYELLRSAASYSEMQKLVGFFLQQRGSLTAFAFTDPADHNVTAESFGTGNGTSTQWQLIRAFGASGFTLSEPVQNLNGSPSIYVNAVLKTSGTDYTIDSSGIVTFTSPPAAAAALTWTGSYYYRCRFSNDIAEFNLFMNELWEAKSVAFIGAIGNKV